MHQGQIAAAALLIEFIWVACLCYIRIMPIFAHFCHLSQNNDWQDDWVAFYAQQKLGQQLGMVENSYGDREARELWSHLQVQKEPN